MNSSLVRNSGSSSCSSDVSVTKEVMLSSTAVRTLTAIPLSRNASRTGATNRKATTSAMRKLAADSTVLTKPFFTAKPIVTPMMTTISISNIALILPSVCYSAASPMPSMSKITASEPENSTICADSGAVSSDV